MFIQVIQLARAGTVGVRDIGTGQDGPWRLGHSPCGDDRHGATVTERSVRCEAWSVDMCEMGSRGEQKIVESCASGTLYGI